MNKSLEAFHQAYTQGKEGRFKFCVHRTYTAFMTLCEGGETITLKGICATMKAALADNSVAGNPYLPSSLKVLLEVLGVGVVAIIGICILKNCRNPLLICLLTSLAALLFLPTASIGSSTTDERISPKAAEQTVVRIVAEVQADKRRWLSGENIQQTVERQQEGDQEITNTDV